MAEVSEEKKEYEKLENSEEEQRKKEKQQAEEEAEKRRVMFLSILKGILKSFADAVMTVAAFTGATIQSFLFGRQTAFANDRNEVNKFKRDVDDAKKMEKESKERNADKSEQAKEQKKKSPENEKQDQEPPEKERHEQSNTNKQDPPEKELTDEEISEAVHKSQKYLDDAGLNLTLCSNNDGKRYFVLTHENDGQKNHYIVPTDIVGAESKTADLTDLVKAFYTESVSGRNLSNEEVLTEPMAAVCKAAAVAEQLVSCTDPDKKGIFARGSVQTCHGKVDFELEREVLATRDARMINHHIIINGQRLDDNLSFPLFSINDNSFIRPMAERMSGFGRGHNEEITLTDTEKIRVSYRESENKFTAVFIQDGKETEMGEYRTDVKGKDKNLGHFFLDIQNLKLIGKSIYKIEPKAVAMATAAFVCPQNPVQLDKNGEEIHMLSRFTYTGNDDKEHAYLKTQPSSPEDPHIRMGFNDNGELVFKGNIVHTKGPHKGDLVCVSVTGRDINDVVKDLSAASIALKRSSGVIEPENADAIRNMNVRSQLDERNAGIMADESQILFTDSHTFDHGEEQVNDEQDPQEEYDINSDIGHEMTDSETRSSLDDLIEMVQSMSPEELAEFEQMNTPDIPCVDDTPPIDGTFIPDYYDDEEYEL